jgi:uncharacterized membrane protein
LQAARDDSDEAWRAAAEKDAIIMALRWERLIASAAVLILIAGNITLLVLLKGAK